MSRNTFRKLFALCAIALVAAIPAIASAHKGGKTHKAGPAPVGSVVSYADGTLVITSGGMPVSGAVTDRTKIKWVDNGLHRGHRRGHGRKGKGRSARKHRSTRKARSASNRHGYGDHTRGGMPTAGGMPSYGGMPPFGRRPRATVDDLKPGTVVVKAGLVLTANGPVWAKIVLMPPAATPAT